MNGKLFGIGIGPGDPELITMKAMRIIGDCQVIAFPGKSPEETLAYDIVSKVMDLSSKQLIGISFPMTKDKELLKTSHEQGAWIIEKYLKKGIDVAFLTLGDPSVYATYIYVHNIVKDLGFETEIIPGVTSFCAAAAKVNEALTETDQQLHVIPASYGADEAMKLPGTKVFMKAGSKFAEVYNLAKESGQKLWVLENIGLKNEKIYCNPTENLEAGYYTIIIVKDN